jgi:hypothetical protein
MGNTVLHSTSNVTATSLVTAASSPTLEDENKQYEEYDLTINIDTMDPLLIQKRGWTVRPNKDLSNKINDRLNTMIIHSPTQSNSPSPRSSLGPSHALTIRNMFQQIQQNSSAPPNSRSNSRPSSQPPSQPPSRPPSPGSTMTSDDLSSAGDISPRENTVLDLSDLSESSKNMLPQLNIQVPAIPPQTQFQTMHMPIPLRPQTEHTQINYFTELENLFTANPHCIVGVTGKRNVGKTHILNRISGSKLKEHYSSHTDGLAFKIPKMNQGRDYLLVDSMGYDTCIKQSTVKYYAKGKSIKDAEWGLRRSILDRKCVEGMVQDMLFNMCHYLLVVVNDVSYNDQHLLHQLIQKRNKHPQSPTIIVIHNFSEAETLNEFNHLVHSKVIEVFSGELRTKEVHGGLAPFFVGDCNHTFLGKEGSECGNKYNELTYSLIRTWLASLTAQRIPSFRDMITNVTNVSVRKYLRNVSEVNMSFVLKGTVPDEENFQKLLFRQNIARNSLHNNNTPPASPNSLIKYNLAERLFSSRVREDEYSPSDISTPKFNTPCLGEFTIQICGIDEDKNSLQLNKELKTDLFGLSVLQNSSYPLSTSCNNNQQQQDSVKNFRRTGSLNK